MQVILCRCKVYGCKEINSAMHAHYITITADQKKVINKTSTKQQRHATQQARKVQSRTYLLGNVTVWHSHVDLPVVPQLRAAADLDPGYC